MSGSNYCFLTCIQVSQEAGKVVRYFLPFKNFPQFVVIHIVKGFRVVNKAEVDVFLKFPCFLYYPANVGNWSLVPLCFLNLVHQEVLGCVLRKPSLKDFKHNLTSM